MGAVAWVVGILLALAFVASGVGKLTKQKMAVDVAQRLNYMNRLPLIGGAEIAGGVGVFLGLLSDGLEFVGFFAALGLLATMIGAIVYHQRGGDSPKEMAPAGVLAVLCVVYLIGLGNN